MKDKIDIYAQNAPGSEYTTRADNSYTFSFSDRADVYFQSATERMTGQLQGAFKTLRFKVRYRANTYTETQAILHRAEYYNIRGIDYDRRRRYMYITAERVPTGSIDITT